MGARKEEGKVLQYSCAVGANRSGASRGTKRAIYLCAEKFSRTVKKASNEELAPRFASSLFTPPPRTYSLLSFHGCVFSAAIFLLFSVYVFLYLPAPRFCHLRHLQMVATRMYERLLWTCSPAEAASFRSRRCVRSKSLYTSAHTHIQTPS